MKENQEFKREVMERGLAAKREITFETDLFGSKTFLIYVEPVFNKAGETIGVNYMGMDITDQVIILSFILSFILYHTVLIMKILNLIGGSSFDLMVCIFKVSYITCNYNYNLVTF